MREVSTRILLRLRFSDPLDGSNLNVGDDAYVLVDAIDGDGSIVRVDLFLDGIFVRHEGRVPFEWTKPDSTKDQVLRNLQEGQYVLTAIATDNEGAQTSASISFTVSDGSQPEPEPEPNQGDYNRTFDATDYDSESHPLDDRRVRDMGNKMGYINNGTSISFDNFIAAGNPPSSITFTYSSNNASGGSVRVISESSSSGQQGVVLGEFLLSKTGGWNNFKTVSFDIPNTAELENIQSGVLTLEFFNSDSNKYLFDIVSFEINN